MNPQHTHLWPRFQAKTTQSSWLQILCLMLLTGLALAQTINIDPPTRSFTKDGGGGSILTSGSGTWTAEKNVSWITITPRTTGTAGQSCIYVVNSNFSADTRQGIITLAGKTHTVTQTGYNATLSPTSGTTNLNGSTGSVSVTVDAGVAWSAVSNAEWVTVSPASGTSSGTVTYTVAPYAGVTNRTTSLTIAGKTFALTQTGTDVNISPKSVQKAYSSDIIQVSVSALATTTWNVTPNTSWISVVDPGNKFGDSTVTLAIGTNPSFADRSGTVSIGSATFTIQQAGTSNPVLDLLPREAIADPIGSYGNVAVLATPDAPWTAESMDPWVFISSGSSGSGNGNIQYVVSANPGLTTRNGRIRVNPPIYVQPVDLTKQLWTYIPGDGLTDDVSGWMRNLSGQIDTFDGTFSRTLSGAAFSRENDNSMSLAIQFTVGNLGTINRLLQIKRSSTSTDATVIYVNAQNKLVLQIGAQTFMTDFSVNAATWYQLALTATNDHQVRLYAAAVGSDNIDLIGSYAPNIAPFPSSYVTSTNRITLGYSVLPNEGYLTNGGMKELRIYGRELTAQEVAALHQSSSNGMPFGVGSIDGSPAPLLKMNLRGQSLAMNGNGVILDAKGLSMSTSDALTTTEKVVRKTRVGGSVIPNVTGNVWLSRSSTSFSGSISWRYIFTYTDASTATTPSRTVTSANGSSSGNVTFMDTNPNPTKLVASIALLAKLSGNNILAYGGSFWGAYLCERQVTNWGRSSDRFGLAQRALVSTGGGQVEFLNHSALFSSGQYSATYNFWLRMDAMTATKTIFTHNKYLSGDLVVSANSGGSLTLSGPVSATFPSPINVGKWHMITLAGSYSPSRISVFVDGEEIGNVPTTSAYPFGNEPNNGEFPESLSHMTIGHSTSGFVGAIDEISFYDRALTPSEIRTIYQREAPQTIYHTVAQGVVDPAVSPQLVQVPAAGGTMSAQLTIAQNVNWTISNATPWITVTTPNQGAGSAAVSFDVAANPTVYQRQGEITIAGKTVTVTQAGLNANVSYGETVFSTDGGSGWVEVSPEGNAQWQSVSDVAWLTVALGESGVGAGSVFIVADPYTNTSQSRTGSVTIAGKKVYFTQRGYTLSITPQVTQVGSNAGAGEFGVAAPISAVWEAIATQPWITVVGGSTGLGNGTVRYSLASNTTGQSRTGRIIVSGKEYTITQLASLLVTTQASSGGTVTGGGSFDVNATATLTATPSAGFAFSHWTGDAVGSANPLQVAVNSNKSVQANFVPTSATTGFFNNGVQSVVAAPNTYGLYKSEQLRSMAMGTPVLEVNQATGKGKIQFGIKQSQDLNNWSDMNINSADVYIRNGKLEIEFTRTGNAAFYQVIGSETSQ